VKGLACAAVVLLVAVPAYAGIVIKKSGSSFVGRIEAGDVTSKTVTLRIAGGTMVFDQGDVRWFDAAADEPTDGYFDRFIDQPLDPRWNLHAERYRERKTFEPLRPVPVIESDLDLLPVTKRFPTCEVSIRKPRDWYDSDTGAMVMFSSNYKTRGEHARIHIYTTDLPYERAVVVTRAALERLGTRFESTTDTGARQEWITSLPRKLRDDTLHALRRIYPTAKGTAFVTAYGDDRNWRSRYISMVRESLDTVRVLEQ
jgi:hypothetical protein